MLQARRSLADVTESVAFNSFPFQWNDSTLLFRHWANWNSGNPSKNIIKQGFPMVFPWNNNQRLGNGGPMAFPWRPSQVLWPPALMGCWKLGEWKAMGKPWFRRMKHLWKSLNIWEVHENPRNIWGQNWGHSSSTRVEWFILIQPRKYTHMEENMRNYEDHLRKLQLVDSSWKWLEFCHCVDDRFRTNKNHILMHIAQKSLLE